MCLEGKPAPDPKGNGGKGDHSINILWGLSSRQFYEALLSHCDCISVRCIPSFPFSERLPESKLSTIDLSHLSVVLARCPLWCPAMAFSLLLQFATALFLLFPQASAKPLALAERGQSCRQNMIAISNVFLAISGNDLSNLQLFSQFSAAAYCPDNNKDKAGGTKLTCAIGNCPLVQDSDVVSVYEFQKYVL